MALLGVYCLATPVPSLSLQSIARETKNLYQLQRNVSPVGTFLPLLQMYFVFIASFQRRWTPDGHQAYRSGSK